MGTSLPSNSKGVELTAETARQGGEEDLEARRSLGAEIGMRLDDTNDMRLDILDWSDPVVGDCLFEAYDSCFGGNNNRGSSESG